MLPHLEGPTQVFHSFASVKHRLGGGITGAFHAIGEGDSAADRKLFGEDKGLVKAPFPLARGMQGHGHEPVTGRRLEAWIIERLRQPIDQDVPQINLTVVFKAVDQFPYRIPALIARYRACELNLAIPAVGAGKGAVDLARKRLRAGFAEGRADDRRLGAAICAEMLPRRGVVQANRAVRRIEQIEKSRSRPTQNFWNLDEHTLAKPKRGAR